MEDRKKRLEEERLARERAEKRKLERRCPECDQKVKICVNIKRLNAVN